MCDAGVINAGGDGGGCACRGVVAGPEYGVCVTGCCGAARRCRLENGGVAGGTDKCEVEPSCWEDLCFLTYLLRPAMCVVIVAIAGITLISPLLILQKEKRCMHAALTSWLSYLL